MGDYYDPTRNGGYLGGGDKEPEKPKNKQPGQQKQQQPQVETIPGCAMILIVFMICVTIVMVVMMFTGYHF
jgi:hypothetical protein